MRLHSRLFAAFGNWIINRATRTPYFHLQNSDGTPYMDRFWLLRIGKGIERIAAMTLMAKHAMEADAPITALYVMAALVELVEPEPTNG